MFKFSKKVEYALISLIYMSKKKDGDLASSREISEQFNIPLDLLGKVLQKLGQKDLVESVRGVKGGYQLSLPLEKITLHQVIAAVDRPINLVECAEAGTGDSCVCAQLSCCNIKNPMLVVQEKVVDFFDTFTLADLKQETSLNMMKKVKQNNEVLEEAL